MAVEISNVIEAMGRFEVDVNGATVIAAPGESAGFIPIGAYNGVGNYAVVMTESRAGKLAFIQLDNRTISPLEGLSINVIFPLNLNEIIIQTGGVAAAPVEIEGFMIMVYNLPSGIF